MHALTIKQHASSDHNDASLAQVDDEIVNYN